MFFVVCERRRHAVLHISGVTLRLVQIEHNGVCVADLQPDVLQRDVRVLHRQQHLPVQLALAEKEITREELHVRLFDDDGILNSDDFFGEVRISMSSLLQNDNNQTCDYPLEGDKAKGNLTIMVGTKVGQALIEEVQNEISLGEQSYSLSPLASMKSSVSRLGIWFADRFNLNMTPAYAVNMARLGMVWALELSARMRKANGQDLIWRTVLRSHGTQT